MDIEFTLATVFEAFLLDLIIVISDGLTALPG